MPQHPPDGRTTATPLFLATIAVIVLVAALREAQSLIVPLLLALFGAAIATPAVGWLRKRGA